MSFSVFTNVGGGVHVIAIFDSSVFRQQPAFVASSPAVHSGTGGGNTLIHGAVRSLGLNGFYYSEAIRPQSYNLVNVTVLWRGSNSSQISLWFTLRYLEF